MFDEIQVEDLEACWVYDQEMDADLDAWYDDQVEEANKELQELAQVKG